MTKFTLQAALEALEWAEADHKYARGVLGAPHDYARLRILRDLRERLAGAQEAWQWKESIAQDNIWIEPHNTEYEYKNARPVLIINVDSEER